MKLPDKMVAPKYPSSAYEAIQLNPNYFGYLEGWNDCLKRIIQLNKKKAKKKITQENCNHPRVREYQDFREHFRKCKSCNCTEDYPFRNLKGKRVVEYS